MTQKQVQIQTKQTNKQTDIDSKAEPASNLPTNPNSDLDETLPNGSQQLVDAPNLLTNLNSDLDKTLPNGSQQHVDGLSLPTHLNLDLDETLPYSRQQVVDAPSLPDNPNSDLDNTLPYGSQQFVDYSVPVTSTCPNPTNLASSELSNQNDDLALPIAIRCTRRPRKPRDILDLWLWSLL